MRTSTKREKIQGILSRSYGAEKNNNQIEINIRGVQQQTGRSERMEQQLERSNGAHPNIEAKKKKEFKIYI